MKIYQSKHRILAAQILAIQQHDTQPLFQLVTDAESVQVDRAWMEKHNPVVGGHVTIAPDTGIAGYMGAIELPTGFDLVGVVDLTPPAEQGQALPEPEVPASSGEFACAPVQLPATYTFDEFVALARTFEDTTCGDDGMPWSFQFFGRPVSHERNDCYLINDGTKVHYFTPAHLVHVTEAQASDTAGHATAIILIAAETPVITVEATAEEAAQ